MADYAASLRSIAFLENVVQQAAASEIECGICLHVLRDPRILPCAHIFCAGCIQRSLQEKAECPQCRSPVRGHSQLNVIHSVRADLRNSDVSPQRCTISSSSSSSHASTFSSTQVIDMALC